LVLVVQAVVVQAGKGLYLMVLLVQQTLVAAVAVVVTLGTILVMAVQE
jgi:hypothetical protein